MIRRKRRLLFGGATAVGVVLTVASAAFACTVFRGTINGDGNGAGDNPKTVNGDPNNGAFKWCENPPAYTEDDLVKDPWWTTRVDFASPSLTVTVGPSNVCLDTKKKTNKLPDEADGKYYKVGISKGYWDESKQGFDPDPAIAEDNCHSLEDGNAGTTGYGDIIDTQFAGATGIDANGNGTETYTGAAIKDSLALGWNTVCVYLPLGGQPESRTQDFNPANALNFKTV